MADVTLYKHLEKTCAQTAEVQAGLDRYAYEIAQLVAADLADKAAHPYSEGKTYVTIGAGRIDRGIILNDPDSDPAPWAIEKGTKNSRGIHTLVAAAAAVAARGL